MTPGHPVTRAREVFREVAGRLGLDPERLDAASAWRVYREFVDERFAVDDSDTGDGLLYQYGTYAWEAHLGKPPMFEVSLVRQLEAGGELYQLDCRVVYEPTPSLTALGNDDAGFWFPSDGPREDWLAEIEAGPEWVVLAEHRPAATTLWLDPSE